MIRIFPTEYTVTELADDDVNTTIWAIKVEWRAGDRWAVTNIGRCLNTNGEWDHEPSPSNRDDEFLRTHRFSLNEAQSLALEAYPKLVINGLWVRDGKVVPADG